MVEEAQGTSQKRMSPTVGLVVIALVVAVAVIVWNLPQSVYIETNNAYVGGHIVRITPERAGKVVAVNASDTQRVAVGYPLLELDRADAYVALKSAEANLVSALQQTKELIANEATLMGKLAQHDANLRRAREYAKRRDPRKGAVTEEVALDAKLAIVSVQAEVAAARGELNAHRALMGDGQLATHPTVETAAAGVIRAFLDVERTLIQSPVNGVVARRTVQIGSRVAAGEHLMSIVDLDNLWVDANFKEVEIANLRTGQPVSLIADVYGAEVVYSGKVVGFSPGSGSSFALLPPQNATGNWIKIVQRVPVRISLDKDLLKEHPLLLGLSMQVSVDTRDHSGASLTPAAAEHDPVEYQDILLQRAQAHVEQLIAKYDPEESKPGVTANAQTDGQ